MRLITVQARRIGAMKKFLFVGCVLATINNMYANSANAYQGIPLVWVYIATADIECNKDRCDINGTVEAHSRPARNSAVVAIFKGGTTSALVQDNIARKWNFFLLQCTVIRSLDNSLSCARDGGGFEK